MNISKFTNYVKTIKFRKIDFGVAKVAFMIAALDGEITEAEYKALEALLKKCRGYSKASADAAMDAAMRSAGYLLLLAHRVSDAALVKAFVAEAQAALPANFDCLSVDEIRRAFITWIAMGLSDGDYSAREKKCIDALRKICAEKQAAHQQVAVSGIYLAAVAPVVVSPDFLRVAAELVAQYGDEKDAAKELEKLVAAE